MSEGRLTVRVALAFFEDLDRQLGPQRGPLGQPSAADFQASELVEIIDRFANEFEELPELIIGRGGLSGLDVDGNAGSGLHRHRAKSARRRY